jgi:hypothetical protein
MAQLDREGRRFFSMCADKMVAVAAESTGAAGQAVGAKQFYIGGIAGIGGSGVPSDHLASGT